MSDLPTLLQKNAALFTAYEEWTNAQNLLITGAIDDADSFNASGGKSGALGYYPVDNISGQTIYVPCFARLNAIAAGATDPGAIETLLGKQVMAAQAAADEAKTASVKFETISDRSGYAGGWQTASGLLGLGFRSSDMRPIFGNGGDIVSRVETTEAALENGKVGIAAAAAGLTIAGATRSGIAFGGLLPTGQMPFHVDNIKGRFYANGRYVAGELDAIGARIDSTNAVLAASKNGIDAAASGLTSAGAGSRSGIAFGGILPNGQMSFHVDSFRGRFYANGRYVTGELDALTAQITVLQAQIANPIQDFPSSDIAAWGDSLTAGGSSGDWLPKLATDLGIAAYNGGTGGQGTRAIAARAGGCPAILATAITIPDTETSVVISIAGGFSPVNVDSPVLFSLDGVLGRVNRNGSNVVTFTRLVAGPAVNVPARTQLLPMDAATHRGRTFIVGMGRNSFRAGTGDFQAVGQIIAAIRSVLDFQSSRVRRAIVWEIPPMQTEPNGNASRALLDSVNAAIKAAFPGEWLDIASWLRTTAPQTVGTVTVNDPFTQLGIAPTAQDLADIANGVTPTTLTSDGLHFTQLAGTAIAYRMKTHMQIKGWIN